MLKLILHILDSNHNCSIYICVKPYLIDGFWGFFWGGIQESYVSIFDIQGAGEDGKNFYESEEDEDEKEETEENEDEPKKKPYIMDSDHRLLLRQTKPLLNSRNAAVSLF